MGAEPEYVGMLEFFKCNHGKNDLKLLHVFFCIFSNAFRHGFTINRMLLCTPSWECLARPGFSHESFFSKEK